MAASPTSNEELESCPVARTLNLLQGKWSTRVLYELQKQDSVRFGELARMIGGITNTVLTSTLRDLEAKGLVNRVQFNEIPPHVEYSLTESGKALQAVFAEMATWAQTYLD